ncbi:MAG TPA: phosphate ABC transporter permease PstA [Candidatus Krumholzibacteria bacterium]|nr:phosphate ABC transporter permease PstA [Candidatus Krumholzibacteria bacterium]HRX51903.1 phosphate ABC transporter permease PstA [Candidatus Krumholzibacteria bacterium]
MSPVNAAPPAAPETPRRPRRRLSGAAGGILARGEPMVWLTGGGLAVCVLMIAGLLALVLWQGAVTFWPKPVERFVTESGDVSMGEVTRRDTYRPDAAALAALEGEAGARARAAAAAHDGALDRLLLRTGNFDLTQEHFRWIDLHDVQPEGITRPHWAVVIERRTWGRFYGQPVGFVVDDSTVATDPERVWALLMDHLPEVQRRHAEARRLEDHDLGRVNHAMEEARLAVRGLERDPGADPAALRRARAELEEVRHESDAAFAAIRKQVQELEARNDRLGLAMSTADGGETVVPLGAVVRIYPANQLDGWSKLGVYLSRWGEFLSADPREANSEGGVFPAIFGTVVMTLIMTLLVVPFGVLAALYLREYAKAGPLVSAVRISVNNLAGVPSIVFGVFGLGFFCYIVGGGLDQLFFAARLPSPTYGTGGVLWASLTLALLTLPVVIVATEEALAAVPGSMREGSYACGASKWQTIRRIVLPRAMPGIMTGAILAMARGAGEVAPLMLVGAVKLAPELPVDGLFPYIHPERSFMHLGFHIYDLGFQSQNSEAAKPMVFTTTLLLITIITLLNVAAVRLRTRLRRRFVASQF